MIKKHLSSYYIFSKFLVSIILIMFALLSMAQKKQFTLEELNFGGNKYFETSPETRHYVWHGNELIRLYIDEVKIVDKNNKENVLFSLDDILQAVDNESTIVGINLLNVSFPYSNESIALIQTPSERWLYDYKEHKVVFTQNSSGSLQWNRESKTDTYLKYEDSNQNLCVRLANGNEKCITKDGNREIVYGRSVHRNEFGIDKGIFFSPDGYKFAFYRMDQSMVEDYPQVNFLGDIATYEPDKYPMSGRRSHKVTIGVYDIKKDTIVWIKLGDSTDRYFTNVSWHPNSKSLYIIELNRDQNHSVLAQYSVDNGEKISNLISEEDTKYVEPQHPISFLPWDDNKFIYWSRQDGWWHLYLYNNSGKLLKQLTSGNYEVTDLLGFDTKNHRVLIRANKESPIQRNLYSVDTETTEISLLDNGVGVHDGFVSEYGDNILDEYSSPDEPRIWTLLYENSNNKLLLGKSIDPWKEYDVPHFKCGKIKAADNQTDLYYRMVLPPQFDENEKYPTIVYVYGGPHAHNIESSWHWNSRSWETYMAQKGYVIFVLDNRGSECRGKEFEQITFRRLGQEEMRDQMKGVEFLKSLKYVDTQKIGVHGWSYGGFMTISLMTNFPETFKVGVAGGPVIDWSKYEIMYTERYMDTPKQNPEGYGNSCLLSKTDKLKGKLLIITGTNDDIVVPQQSLMFLNSCNEVGTYPDFYMYPGEGHNMQGHMSVHLHEKITRYFEDNLK